ncbi:uncharacterized protein LOC143239931 isoform X2 [Tachypleus tridentatus]|uniref:uncharacterized protein LOC143239931 isoform X2 n=1 Tax=Tachypleus tridentatus TaxID=6853 RepID=UPI003FD66F73
MVVSRRKMKYISKLFWLFLICFIERNLGDNVSEHSYYVEHVEDSVLANSGSNSSDINIGNHDTVGFDKETTSAFEVEGCSRFTNCTSCVDAGCVFIQCSIKNVTDKKFDPLCEKDNEIIQLSKEKCSGELNAISQSALCSHHANVNDENTDISSDIPG